MPLDTIFAPLISPDRVDEYELGDFVLASHDDGTLDITFTPKARRDLDLFMPAPGLILFLPAGAATPLPGGPIVTPAADALAIQILNMTDILAVIGPASAQPAAYAPWWVIEGVDADSFIDFVKADGQEERKQSEDKLYPSVQVFREGLLLGQTSFNVSCKDEDGAVVDEPIAIASLAGDPDVALTFRLATYYAYGDPIQYALMPAAGSLAAIALLQPALATHPVVETAGGAVNMSDLPFYVKFQFWSPAAPVAALAREVDKGSFVPMPPGTVVKLVKVTVAAPHVHDPIAVAAGTLDANGMVQFAPNAAIARGALEVDPAIHKLAFLVEAPGALFVTQYQRDGAPSALPSLLGWNTGAPKPWPEIWLTFGLTAATGEAGSLGDLDLLPSFGLPSAPVVYNVGIPVFLQILHARLLSDARVYRTLDERSPKGVKVLVRNHGGEDLGEFRTDEHGQVWGLVTKWDPNDTNIRIIVVYDMEDRPAAGIYPLQLPRVTGSVPGAVAPAATDHFDSDWADTVPVPALKFGFSGEFSDASLGTTTGGVLATGLSTVRIGSIWTNGQRYELVRGAGPTLGEHGGLMDAFKAIRHAHEWWYQLTDDVGALVADPTNADEVALKTRWATLFNALHRPAPADAGLVVEVVQNPDVRVRGGASVIPTTDRFQLNLLYPNTWDQASPVDPALPVSGANPQLSPGNLPLLWNRETVHHEFGHVVFQVAAEINTTNAGVLAVVFPPVGPPVYNSAYHVGQVEIETFTPLLEGLSNILTAACLSSGGTLGGFTFGIDPAGTGTINVFNFLGAAPPELLINSNPALRNDARMGLWIPGAVARGFWDFLHTANPALESIYDHRTAVPAPDKPDLRDSHLSIVNLTVRRLFQRTLWLPMRALRIPDHAAHGGTPAQWDDGGAAGTRASYPTTFSLLRHFANDADCYRALALAPLAPADQQRARDIFGTGLATSWYLWNPWP